MDLSKAKRGYFVGIGGVGVNALAKFVADFGIQISGSDAKINGLCNGLIKNGAKMRIFWCFLRQFRAIIPK